MDLVKPIDAAWVIAESSSRHMHVGCLQIFSFPKSAKSDYVSLMVSAMRRPCKLEHPYSLKLKPWMLEAVLPAWCHDERVDLGYHVQHVTLPKPLDDQGLAELIADLHSRPLDMRRPLWECHVIEGLSSNRFGLFMKIHHSLMDGVSGMRLLQAGLSTDSRRRHMPSPWARHAIPHDSTTQTSAAYEHPHGGLKHAFELAFSQFRTAPGLYRAFAAFVSSARRKSNHALSAPYLAPRTLFNGRTSEQRRFASLQLQLKRIHDVAHFAGVTVNDVFLSVCGGALRRYLEEEHALPKEPLIAGCPVSVRPEGDTSAGTAVTFMLASLGTNESDPLLRLQQVHRSTAAAKDHLHRLRREALTEYTLLLMTPYALELLLGLGGRGHPVFNVVISNVPGPQRPLYFNGARLEAMFPMSVLTHGQSLNITVLSYFGQLHVGFTACGQAVPQVQRLAQFVHETFEQLAARVPTGAASVGTSHLRHATAKSRKSQRKKTVDSLATEIPSPESPHPRDVGRVGRQLTVLAAR